MGLLKNRTRPQGVGLPADLSAVALAEVEALRKGGGEGGVIRVV